MSNLPEINSVNMSWEDTRAKNRRMIVFSTALLDFISGLLIIGAGIVFVKKNHFGIRQLIDADNDGLLIPLFGGVCIIYGLWRFYRGYLKIKAR
jgi:hypothetical protein